jgi:hypothetical protein
MNPHQDPLPRNPRLLTRYDSPRVTGIYNSMHIIHGRIASSHVCGIRKHMEGLSTVDYYHGQLRLTPSAQFTRNPSSDLC